MNTRACKLLAAAFVAASFSSNALAAEQWVSDYVKFVYPMATGDFVLVFNNSPPTCPATGNPKYLYVEAGKNGVNADGVKAMLATSLAAFVAGKRIQAAFDDATAGCYINRLVIID